MSTEASIKSGEFIATATRTLILGLCAEGRLDDARAHLEERVKALAADDADNLLECRNLQAMVERHAKSFYKALRIHLEALPLLGAANHDILRARFHSGLGITYEVIAGLENSPSCYEHALDEYEQARRYFQAAGDIDGAGDVENNVAMFLCALGRTTEAREHVKQARVYLSENPVKLAQTQDTEARIYLAEGNPQEALYLVSAAICVFIRHGETRLRDEAIRTQMKAAADCLSQIREG